MAGLGWPNLINFFYFLLFCSLALATPKGQSVKPPFFFCFFFVFSFFFLNFYIAFNFFSFIILSFLMHRARVNT
jgi:hypothetical protein